jgi:polyhydroxyalkanoate synthesis regulator phasin
MGECHERRECGHRGDKTTRNFLDSTQDTLRQPFQKEDKALEELRKRVEELENK